MQHNTLVICANHRHFEYFRHQQELQGNDTSDWKYVSSVEQMRGYDGKDLTIILYALYSSNPSWREMVQEMYILKSRGAEVVRVHDF